jgi:hypothetical protein
MSQTNSEPGKNQAAGTVAVSSASVEVGATHSKAIATNTVVKYSQSEPGAASKPIRN